ncbi:4Fe-4S dicluster domain-containing protein [bacterium]|nr:4Fe-4S dicluster domain-containing protein [bacterium]
MWLPKLRELREAVKSLFSRPATTRYPFKPATIHPRFKGKPEPQDSCIGCGGCVNWCPSEAIEEINDAEGKKRQVIWHLDHCIMCGECERVCTTKDGVKMVPEFELAVFSRDDLHTVKEFDLVVCEECGEILSTRDHILWMLDSLGEKQPANLGLLNEKLKKLGIVDDASRSITFDKRDDMFVVLCPKCRHRISLYDSL